MLVQSILRLLASCVLVSVGVHCSCLHAEAMPPGLSSVKPASGPAVKVAENRFMVPYQFRVPGTERTIEMVPVPGGSFLFGSPDGEANRKGDEGPQVRVKVDPMWVAKTEVTWGVYKQYMQLYDSFKQFEFKRQREINERNQVDVVTAPTILYSVNLTFAAGDDDQQPAVTMTQYAAQQFTKWLSLLTGQQYRLPTEAEWEYAARAGTQTAFSWGDGIDKIDDYAWYFDNSEDGYGQVGTKLANGFGLHDMHGNVAEWTVNAYTAEGYAGVAAKPSINATELVSWPTASSPCVVRGGSWEMAPQHLRSASRLASSDQWKDNDPCFPQSPWWLTSDPARGVGFRLFRSYRPLDRSTITKFWQPQDRDVQRDVESPLKDGRSALGPVDPGLPAAIKQIEEK